MDFAQLLVVNLKHSRRNLKSFLFNKSARRNKESFLAFLTKFIPIEGIVLESHHKSLTAPLPPYSNANFIEIPCHCYHFQPLRDDFVFIHPRLTLLYSLYDIIKVCFIKRNNFRGDNKNLREETL